MARPLIGRTVRRIRTERGMTQQALAVRLGISASYLNLIEHDQRAVTAAVLFKLTEALGVDLAALSGHAERQLEAGLREVLADPVLGLDSVPEGELQAMAAAAPNAARGVLALYRAWRVAREDSSGIALPSGRRLLLPTEEARDFFHERGNHFPELERFAEKLGAELRATPAEMNHAIAERLRNAHGVRVTVAPMPESDRRFDQRTRDLWLAESLPRESRGFRMAFQLMLLEAREVVDATLGEEPPSSTEATQLIRIGLLNYAAAVLLMPYMPFLHAARELRHDVEKLAARFGVSYEQAAQRLSTLSPAERDLFWNMVRTPKGKRDMKAVTAAVENSAKCWAILEARLADGRPFIEGTAFTLADIVLGCFARRWFGPEVQVPGMPEFPLLAAWYARLGERPGFQKWVAPPLF